MFWISPNFDMCCAQHGTLSERKQALSLLTPCRISANWFFRLQETHLEGLVVAGSWDGVNALFFHFTNVQISQFHICCIWNDLRRNAESSKWWWQPLPFPFTRPVLLPGPIIWWFFSFDNFSFDIFSLIIFLLIIYEANTTVWLNFAFSKGQPSE